MCGLLELGGTINAQGKRVAGLAKMVCATATQVNMVAATIQVDAKGAMSLNHVSRFPSDLNYLRADYWFEQPLDNNYTAFVELDPYQRFTMRGNPHSPTIHFIPHHLSRILQLSRGRGSGAGGAAFSQIGDVMLGSNITGYNYAALSLLDEGFDTVNVDVSVVTRWMGQIGASYLGGSVGYNGWAARASAPIRVASTGGKIGSCYSPPYAVAFLPLLLSALFVIMWSLCLHLRSSLFGSSPLSHAYEGLGPYQGVVCPGAPVKDTLLVWEGASEPHLEVVSEEHTGMDDSGTALSFFKSRNSKP
jgi:hypothetical protein